jgi:hypothetical protein
MSLPSLPAFAGVDDLAARIPRGIKDGDEERAQATLDDASALIRTETGMDWESDFPDIVFTVTLWSARRSFENPSQLTQESVSGWSGTFASASPDVYLTSNEKRLVRKAAGLAEVGVVPTSRGEPLETRPLCDEETGTQYLSVDPVGDKDIPFAGPDGY